MRGGGDADYDNDVMMMTMMMKVIMIMMTTVMVLMTIIAEVMMQSLSKWRLFMGVIRRQFRTCLTDDDHLSTAVHRLIYPGTTSVFSPLPYTRKHIFIFIFIFF